MTKRKRIKNIIYGLFMLAIVVMLLAEPQRGYLIVLYILTLTLLIYGINQLIYYFAMAKYMVGGKVILCKAFIVINLGLQAWGLTDVPKMYVMIYLVIGLIFNGFVDVLGALDAKKIAGARWRLKLCQGVVTILISIVGLFYVNSTNIVIYLFCFGLVSAALTRIIEAFRKTAMVYV